MHENCTIIGYQSNVFGDTHNVFLYGDNLSSNTNHEVIVGDTVFGHKIPETVKSMINANPSSVEWVVKLLFKTPLRRQEV